MLFLRFPFLSVAPNPAHTTTTTMMPSAHSTVTGLGLLFLLLLTEAGTASAAHSNPLKERALKKRAATLIPDTCFDSQDDLEMYFEYNYPWGDTHNGAALMASSQATIVDNAYLQLEALYTGDSDYAYTSGTVYAKQHFTVEADGGLDFQANFVAPVDEGCWPAFWLDGVNSCKK